jgi:hypothetical protein
MAGRSETTGVLIMRVWHEEPRSLRIRVTRVEDVSEGTEPDSTVVASTEAAIAIVRGFLDQLQ